MYNKDIDYENFKKEIDRLFPDKTIFKSNNWRRMHGLPMIHKHKKAKLMFFMKNKNEFFNLIEETVDKVFLKHIINDEENLYQSFVDVKGIKGSFYREQN